MFLDKLYVVQSKNDNMAIVKLSDASHPVFKAHFPSHPVLPGFVHLEIISNAFGIEIDKIKKAKFLKTALPEQILIYERNSNKFKVLCDKQEIASFVL